MHFLSF